MKLVRILWHRLVRPIVYFTAAGAMFGALYGIGTGLSTSLMMMPYGLIGLVFGMYLGAVGGLAGGLTTAFLSAVPQIETRPLIKWLAGGIIAGIVVMLQKDGLSFLYLGLYSPHTGTIFANTLRDFQKYGIIDAARSLLIRLWFYSPLVLGPLAGIIIGLLEQHALTANRGSVPPQGHDGSQN